MSARAPWLLAAAAALNVGLTAVVQLVILAVLRPGPATDAFLAAQTVPLVLFSVVATGLARGLLPVLHESGPAAPGALASIAAGSGAVSILATLVLAGTAPWWAPRTVPGFDAAGRELAVSLAQIHCLGLALMVIVAVLTAGHHLREQFIRVEAWSVVTLLALVAALPAALSRYGVAAAAWLQVARLLLLCGLLALALPWTGARVSREPMRRAWQRLRPLIGGTAVVKLGPLLDRGLASFAPAGALSLLNLAQQGHVALLQVADRSVTARLSRASLGDASTFAATRDAYRRHLRLALVVGIPFAVLVTLAVAGAALALVQLGWAAPANALRFAGIMVALAAMPVGGLAGQLAAGVLYAQGATDVVTRVALRGFALSCVVKVVAFWLWGIYGLAFGIAFYQLVNGMLLHNAVMRRLRETP